jgi:hypothetical protein
MKKTCPGTVAREGLRGEGAILLPPPAKDRLRHTPFYDKNCQDYQLTTDPRTTRVWDRFGS